MQLYQAKDYDDRKRIRSAMRVLRQKQRGMYHLCPYSSLVKPPLMTKSQVFNVLSGLSYVMFPWVSPFFFFSHVSILRQLLRCRLLPCGECGLDISIIGIEFRYLFSLSQLLYILDINYNRPVYLEDFP